MVNTAVKSLKGTIGFQNYRISCVIGDNPEERVITQEIAIDVRVTADFATCAATDHLGDTINYVDLADVCTRVATTGRYRLLETLACGVLQALLQEFEISWAWIRIRKASALPSAEFATVELEMHQEQDDGMDTCYRSR